VLNFRRRTILATVAFFAIASALTGVVSNAAAAEPTKIRFTLDWKLQGLHAWYFWAKAKNYFAAENLDVTIDQGEGSAVTVSRILSGAYDAGFGDLNAAIQLAAAKPGEAPVTVYMIYNKAPFAIVTKASSPIHSVKDLSGHKVGGPPGGATLALLLLLEAKNGVDPASVSITNVAPSLQEQILIQGQVDASLVFTATSYMNLLAQKLDPDKDFRWIYYADSGIDLYSNGVMVSPKLIKDHPEAVRGLVRAINRALKETVTDPNAAVDLLAQVEPLINKDIEKRRLVYVYKTLVDTPETRALGLGDVDDTRLDTGIATLVQTYNLPRTPKAGEVFDRSFLPPKADRMPVTLTN
jgi:NitT/TauT family transport system substrate-binding protein